MMPLEPEYVYRDNVVYTKIIGSKWRSNSNPNHIITIDKRAKIQGPGMVWRSPYYYYIKEDVTSKIITRYRLMRDYTRI